MNARKIFLLLASVLRMPLHSPYETLSGHIYRLHQAVRRGSHGLQPGRQLLHRLMMAAVHGYPVRPEAPVQRRALDYRDLVRGSIVGRLLPVAYAGRVLRRKILIKRASEVCVYELYPAADP